MLYDETNPDWVPNINMGYLRKYPQQDRHSRLEQRKRRRLVTEVQDEVENERASVELVSHLEQSKRRRLVTGEKETRDEVETEMASVELVSKSVQTENDFMKMIEEIHCLKEDNQSLRDNLLTTKSHKYNPEFTPEFLQKNEGKLKFYTGIT